ncbi:amino acid ABC transporter permease [Silvimonas sp. JCM 19000]
MTAIAWLDWPYLRLLGHGLAVTVALAAVCVLLALALGFALALAGRQRWGLPLTQAYTAAFRNTPLLLQLFFWYFGAMALLPDMARDWLNRPHALWPTPETLAATLGLTLYTAAYFAEDIRAGLRGVSAGQWEAALAMGLRPAQAFRFVVLPQALRIAAPALIGQIMNAVKNSSLTMAIGMAELSYTSRQVEAATFKTFQAFGFATLGYVLLIVLIETGWQIWRRQRPAWTR